MLQFMFMTILLLIHLQVCVGCRALRPPCSYLHGVRLHIFIYPAEKYHASTK